MGCGVYLLHPGELLRRVESISPSKQGGCCLLELPNWITWQGVTKGPSTCMVHLRQEGPQDPPASQVTK